MPFSSGKPDTPLNYSAKADALDSRRLRSGGENPPEVSLIADFLTLHEGLGIGPGEVSSHIV